jgi:hypothetical protein
MTHYRSADVHRRNLDGRGNRHLGEEADSAEERTAGDFPAFNSSQK